MGQFPTTGRLLAAHHFVFLLSAHRELDEEISADLADEVGATTLVLLVLMLWGLGGGAEIWRWLLGLGMSLGLERGW